MQWSDAVVQTQMSEGSIAVAQRILQMMVAPAMVEPGLESNYHRW